MFTSRLLAGLGISFLALTADGAVVAVDYAGGSHVEPYWLSRSNFPGFGWQGTIYGDGANAGVSPQLTCVDGTVQTCADRSLVAGDNGLYWSVAAPTAHYAGTLTYDDAVVVNYQDQFTGVVEPWYRVTGGLLSWTGTVGYEVVLPPGSASGGSAFGVTWTDGSIDLATGQRALGGVACQAVMSPPCQLAGLPTYFPIVTDYAGTGFSNPNFALLHDLGNGEYELMLQKRQYFYTNTEFNVQERLVLTAVPVPAAAGLLGPALALLGVAGRRVRGGITRT